MTKQLNSIGSLLGSTAENYFLSSLLEEDIQKYNPDFKYKMLVFWGGEDIWPGYYNEKATKTDAFTESGRDAYEKETFLNNIDTPKLGICRGAQLLCALSGGKLWQHVDKHGQNHLVKFHENGQLLQVTSTHHQMMRPTPNMRLLASADYVRSPKKWNEDKDPHLSTDPEAEIVFIPETRSLCIQGHPEYTHTTSPFSRLTVQLVRQYLS